MTFDLDLRKKLRKMGMDYFNKYYSEYSGEVADTKDPSKSGRIKVKVPALYGEDVHDYWATPKAIPNGGSEGLFWIPKKGDKVWVSFENGDCRYPVWTYGYWGTTDEKGNNVLAGIYDENGEPTKRQMTTSRGQTLLFDDKEFFMSLKTDGKILMGSYSADEAAILGKKYKEWMSNLVKEVASAKVITMLGVMPLLNSAEIALYISTLDNHLSQKTFLDQ